MATFNFPNWFAGLQPIWEAVVLPRVQQMQKNGPIKWLELGSFEGRSALWTHDNVLRKNIDRLVCVDAWFQHAVEQTFDDNMQTCSIEKHKALTTTYLTAAVDKFHVIYIDAGHHAVDVLTDAVLSWRRLLPGGLLIFDDYLYQPPPHVYNQLPTKIGIDAFLSCYELEFRVLHKHKQVIVQKFS